MSAVDKTSPHYAIGYTHGHIGWAELALRSGNIDRALQYLREAKEALENAAPMLGSKAA